MSYPKYQPGAFGESVPDGVAAQSLSGPPRVRVRPCNKIVAHKAHVWFGMLGAWRCRGVR